ncbi:hypothetical protein HYW55_03155 [Candidatus Gottesmanbacteria bacterium]|nr:hypothetical protein [Candidatus Gottesmanbacteria bacterium]
MNLLNNLGFISQESFLFLEKKSQGGKGKAKILSAIADLIRYNTLLSVARAGTGHLGASLSIIELLTEIYFRSFSFSPKESSSKDRDIFILSKGHAVPSLYATLSAKGYFPIENLNRLRRLHGLSGHCDIETPGIEANTGSLAMGISKAVGFALFKKRMGYKGSVIVIVGDGELQEGQLWESLLSAVSFKVDNLYIIIDDNSVQTDQFTQNILKYNDIVHTLSSLGFTVVEKNGKKIKNIHDGFMKLAKSKKPKLLYMRTVKGQGVSYMEHPNVLKSKIDRYIWHNKAPDRKQLDQALREIYKRVKDLMSSFGFVIDLSLSLKDIPKEPMQKDVRGSSLITGFSDALLDFAKKYQFVTLDGDLEEDSGFVEFHKRNHTRFFEMGIMEQHMVSTAAAFSRSGTIPIVSTYAAFLTSRANEQLYNLATEGGKAIIVGNMSGVIPATPGKSHQAFRDIACIKNIPGVTMYQPITPKDVENVLGRYFNNELGNILYVRLSMASGKVELNTPSKNLEKGKAHILREGKNILVIGIGPVVIAESIVAAINLERDGISVEVWNQPWLIEFDRKQLLDASKRGIPLLIVEDHYKKGGFGESLLAYLTIHGIQFPRVEHIALRDFPQTGFREEVLKYLGLDSNTIQQTIHRLWRN